MSEQQYKEKFRPDSDPTLESEVEAALGGLTVDQIVAQGPQQPRNQGGGDASSTKRGKVISIGKDDVFVDFGGKSQAMAPLSQFTEVKIGDEFDFTIDRYDEREGVLLLNRKGVLSANVSWDNLNIGAIVEGMVTGMNKGGLELEIKGMRAFMPAGQVDLYFNSDISVFIGQKMIAEVTQFDQQAKNLIVSRRHILEREKEEHRQKTMAELARRADAQGHRPQRHRLRRVRRSGRRRWPDARQRNEPPPGPRIPSEFVKVGDLVE